MRIRLGGFFFSMHHTQRIMFRSNNYAKFTTHTKVIRTKAHTHNSNFRLTRCRCIIKIDILPHVCVCECVAGAYLWLYWDARATFSIPSKAKNASGSAHTQISQALRHWVPFIYIKVQLTALCRTRLWHTHTHTHTCGDFIIYSRVHKQSINSFVENLK